MSSEKPDPISLMWSGKSREGVTMGKIFQFIGLFLILGVNCSSIEKRYDRQRGFLFLQGAPYSMDKNLPRPYELLVTPRVRLHTDTKNYKFMLKINYRHSPHPWDIQAADRLYLDTRKGELVAECLEAEPMDENTNVQRQQVFFQNHVLFKIGPDFARAIALSKEVPVYLQKADREEKKFMGYLVGGRADPVSREIWTDLWPAFIKEVNRD